MKKVLLFFMLLTILVCEKASAANWIWIGSSDTANYQIDKSSIRISEDTYGTSVEAWFKISYNPPFESHYGTAEFSIKKSKYTINTYGKVLNETKQVMFYSSSGSVIHTKNYEGMLPKSDGELCFVALVDYILDKEQYWMQKLFSGNRWRFIAATTDEEFWIDEYSLYHNGDSATFHAALYDRATRRIEDQIVNADFKKNQLNYKDVLPDSVGEKIITEVKTLTVNPTENMIAWKKALDEYKRQLKIKIQTTK